MHSTPLTMLIAAVLATFLFVDTIVILRTGHTPGLLRGRLKQRQPYGPVMRKGRPQRFWSYVAGNVAVFAMATAYIAMSLIFPGR
jgi:hypothetical protein